MVLVPAVVPGTGSDPAPKPVFEIVTLPIGAELPPGRFHVTVTVEFGAKFAKVKFTTELTIPRLFESATLAGSGMVTVTAPVCAARVELSPRTLFAPAAALLGTATCNAPLPSAAVVIVPISVHFDPTSHRTFTG
jgi:hypothetical protein